MTAKQKKHLYFAIGIAISVILIWVLFREVDFPQLAVALKGANYWWLLPNIAFIFLTMYQRAFRWKYMLAPIVDVPFPKLLAATCIGFMANNVLPLRLGEFMRAYSLAAQDRRISKSASLATIFVERMVFDLVALLLIFGAVLYLSHLTVTGEMQFGLNLTILSALLGLVFMLVLALRPAQTGRLLSKYLFLPEKGRVGLERIVVRFSRGLDFLSDRRAVVSVSLQTLLIWLLMGLSNIFVFWAFGLHLPLDASYVLLVVVSISILIPSSPGFVGVYHAGAVWSMMQYGVAKEVALSCALVMHAAQFIVITGMGFYYLKKAHLSLKDLGDEAQTETQ